MIEKALGAKLVSGMFGQKRGVQERKNNYGLLTQILPYSDRREIKVKFGIPDLTKIADDLTELRQETTEWLGMVYRATASICWNMLANAYLSFEEVKVLFTENIIFNFIEYMK